MQRINVLVADDHVIVRLGIVTLVNRQQDMHVVAEASSGQQVVEQWRAHRPDVTLMDLRMPGMTGIEAIQAIRAEDAQARIIVLTIHMGDDAVYRALRAGAQGYLLKDVDGRDLVAAIRNVHEGQPSLPPLIAARMLRRIREPELSPREIRVLRLVGQGLSNREIGVRLEISEATAKSDVASLLAKLGVQDRTHAVMVALQREILHLEDIGAEPGSHH